MKRCRSRVALEVQRRQAFIKLMPTPDTENQKPATRESTPAQSGATRPLPPAAERALAEAAARKAARDRMAAEKPAEAGGPSGLDPVRYGDWERKGIASDF
jgi:hypothetical protein